MDVSESRLDLGWRADLLRMTAFPGLDSVAPEGLSNLGNWWSQLYPDTSPARSKQDWNRSFQKVSGMVGKVPVSLSSDPLRFDLKHGGIDPEKGPIKSIEMPIVDDALPAFLESADRWFGLLAESPLNRLAFGVYLVIPVDTRKEAYSLLDAILHNVNLSEESRDFTYRINYRCQSRTLPDFEVNRLSQWACQNRTLTITRPDGSSSHQTIDTICSVQLDINTVPVPEKTLPIGKMSELLRELVELGRDFVAAGAKP